jgi:hypothetical protein
MTLVICCESPSIDVSNTYNNDVSAIYNVPELIGLHSVRIVRVECIRPTGASQPLMLSLNSPVFKQTTGNYLYPVFSVPNNAPTTPGEFPVSSLTSSLGLDTIYTYNFDGTFPLYVNDMYMGLALSGSQTLYELHDPKRLNVCIISLDVLKLD